MDLKQVMRNYGYDLPLMDALNDPELSPDRRVLAGATIGVCLRQAYFAVSELEEAFALLADDDEHGRRVGEGYLAMEAVLEGRHDYQMRLWHLVNEVSLDQAVSDLRWLKVLVHQRGQMTTTMAGAGLDPRYWTGEEGREGKSAGELMARVVERC